LKKTLSIYRKRTGRPA